MNLEKTWILGIIVIAVAESMLMPKDAEVDRRWSETQKPNAVNAVIGDESYRATFGEQPDACTTEQERITTHLAYVHDKLVRRNVDHLTESQKQKRLKNLQRLAEYIRRGEFPRNEAFPGQRRPNFIDSNGRICAVGYLIEQSLGREVAKKINAKYQYEYVMNMESDLLENWASKNGFTLRELAMIQPGYGGNICFCPEPQKDKMRMNKKTESILIGANAGLALVNGYLGFKKSASVIPASAGIALGASTITLGLTDHANYSTSDYITGGLSVAAGSCALYSIFNDKPSNSNLTVVPIHDTRYKGNVGVSLSYSF